jgi:hypothetical protein
MKTFAPMMTCLLLLVPAGTVIAEDASDRQPDALRGIVSVAVKVSDKSKISDLPTESMVQSQMENLLQTKCGLAIVSKTSSPGPEVHVDLLRFPASRKQPGPVLLLVRTSVWRPVVPVLAEGQTAESKQGIPAAGWLLTAIINPEDEERTLSETLSDTLSLHISELEAGFRATGKAQLLPKNFSEAFFLSRLPHMKTKINALIKQKIKELPNVKDSDVKVHAELMNGVLIYSFEGNVSYLVGAPVPHTADASVNAANPKTRLDLAALAAIGSLSDAKLNFHPPQEISDKLITVSISDLFQ